MNYTIIIFIILINNNCSINNNYYVLRNQFRVSNYLTPVTKTWHECDTVVNPGMTFCPLDWLSGNSLSSDSLCHLHFINLPTWNEWMDSVFFGPVQL